MRSDKDRPSKREQIENLRARRGVIAAVRSLARQGEASCRELPGGDLLVEGRDGRAFLLGAERITRVA